MSSPSILLLPKNVKGILIAFFQCLKAKEMDVIVVDFHKKKTVSKHTFTNTNVKKFIEDIPKLFTKRFKAIILNLNPKKILFAVPPTHASKIAFIKNQIFKDFVVEITDLKRFREYDARYAVEMAKWLLDKSYVKYYFLPSSAREYELIYISYQYETPLENIVISIPPAELLPIQKKACMEKNVHGHKVYLVSTDPITLKRTTLQEIYLHKNCHVNNLTLSIDSESFPTFTIEPYLIPAVLAMPKTLNTSQKSKIPFIGIYGLARSSVICYCKNDESEYEFMDSWNGIYGRELIISFHNKKPLFGPAVQEHGDLREGSVICDVVRIMSMPADNIKIEKYWSFKIINDAHNPVLIEFNDFDGSRKAASPAFLMAMLLRQHLKALEAELGKKPTTLGFCFFDSFTEDEKKRIEKQFQESCNLLKIDCSICTFVKE